MKEQAEIFKALSEEIRLRLMVLLTHGELRVQDMVDITGMPQSTISRHLSYLKNCGLVTMRNERAQSFYGINRDNKVLTSTIAHCLENCFTNDAVARQDARVLPKLVQGTIGKDEKPHAVRILYVCVHNSARSQMAEAFTRYHGGDGVFVCSAGLEPGGLNPLIIKVMNDAGVSLNGLRSKHVDDLLRSGEYFDYVITVCAESEGQRCPVFPGNVRRLHWEFEDPARIEGSYDEKYDKCCIIRDRIGVKVTGFLDDLGIGKQV